MNKQPITKYYETDHDRLDGIFQEFQQTKRKDVSKAIELFSEFQSGLIRHIAWEEEVLFPLFEQKTGMVDSGPTHVMRGEHRMIKKYLEAINAKITTKDPDCDDDEQALLNTLFAHNQKEERILYPAIDHSLVDAEVNEVFTAMEKMK